VLIKIFKPLKDDIEELVLRRMSSKYSKGSIFVIANIDEKKKLEVLDETVSI